MSEYNTLYIIGNGFDLAHGLRSSYKNFKEWLDENKYYTDITSCIACSEEVLWSDFEGKIIDISPDDIKKGIEALMHNDFFGNGYDLSPGYHVQVREVQIGVNYSYYSLKEEFHNWVKHLNEQLKNIQCRDLPLKTDAFFLSFNYTDTLEDIYGIPENNIWHIHGEADDFNLTIGGDAESLDIAFTDIKLSKINSEAHQHWYDLVKTQLRESYGILSKDVGYIIKEHEKKFSNLSTIQDIYIIGHSLNDIDKPYFYKVAEVTDENQPTWHVVYHITENSEEAEQGEKARIEAFFVSIGVNSSRIRFIKSSDYYKKSNLMPTASNPSDNHPPALSATSDI